MLLKQILFVSSVFMFPAASCFLYDKLREIIIHYLNYLFTHPVSGRSSFICFVLQHKVRKKPHFSSSSSLTELTAQCSVSIGVISLGCETNVSNVPDPDQESDSGTGVTRGYIGAPLDGQAGNCKPGRPGAQAPCVYLAAFTSDVTTL